MHGPEGLVFHHAQVLEQIAPRVHTQTQPIQQPENNLVIKADRAGGAGTPLRADRFKQLPRPGVFWPADEGLVRVVLTAQTQAAELRVGYLPLVARPGDLSQFFRRPSVMATR